MYFLKDDLSLTLRLADKAAEFLFPMGTYCICCGKYVDSTRSYALCDHCIRHISWGNFLVDMEGFKADDVNTNRRVGLDSVLACMGYGLYERRIIFELKYNSHTYVARIIGKIMYDRLMTDNSVQAADMLRSDYIVTVPLHRDKEKSRGFNQTDKIAGYLGSAVKIPVLKGGLVRTKQTAAQRSIAGRDRYANLIGAFEAAPWLKTKIKGKNILLLDDIFTTGATAMHCADILKECGAARVDFLCLAAGNDYVYDGGITEKN